MPKNIYMNAELNVSGSISGKNYKSVCRSYIT